jgi:hypothetical protein
MRGRFCYYNCAAIFSKCCRDYTAGERAVLADALRTLASQFLITDRVDYYSATLVMRHIARLFDTILRHVAVRVPLARVASPFLVLRQKSFATRRMTKIAE